MAILVPATDQADPRPGRPSRPGEATKDWNPSHARSVAMILKIGLTLGSGAQRLDKLSDPQGKYPVEIVDLMGFNGIL